ncbi:hypothetical protein RND81_07G113300 [Saponaria officinalis]|uniref:Uncharacterized protein n=1 Tax=Saponaria officinalis TaxID=3572 RepID=A0AAW1JRF3_SAPOF
MMSSKKKARTTCLCSPTNHPGSFRCHRHRNTNSNGNGNGNSNSKQCATKKWEAAKKMAKDKECSSKAVLLQMMMIINPSSHHLHRKTNFQAKPSRFYVLNFQHHPLPVS